VVEKCLTAPPCQRFSWFGWSLRKEFLCGKEPEARRRKEDGPNPVKNSYGPHLFGHMTIQRAPKGALLLLQSSSVTPLLVITANTFH